MTGGHSTRRQHQHLDHRITPAKKGDRILNGPVVDRKGLDAVRQIVLCGQGIEAIA
jgi:hypothetical protein